MRMSNASFIHRAHVSARKAQKRDTRDRAIAFAPPLHMGLWDAMGHIGETNGPGPAKDPPHSRGHRTRSTGAFAPNPRPRRGVIPLYPTLFHFTN